MFYAKKRESFQLSVMSKPACTLNAVLFFCELGLNIHAFQAYLGKARHKYYHYFANAYYRLPLSKLGYLKRAS
jgi:hypothetical protein